MLRRKFIEIIIAMMVLFCASVITSWAVEVKPGDTIDSSNIEQYEDYFPYFMQRYIKDGWNFEKAVVVKVKKNEPMTVTKAYAKASQKNIGVCKLTVDGLLENYSHSGAPFPDPKEPHLALKVMWNKYYREMPDDWTFPNGLLTFAKRHGGRLTGNVATYNQLKFSNRNCIDPIPELPNNPNNLYYANVLDFMVPPLKNMATLTWRYKDPLKYDDMWTYVPTLRRTLRMVSSERANPIRGGIVCWDDIGGFDGRIPLFTYKLLREQKILTVIHLKWMVENFDRDTYPFHPILNHNEEFEERDCYVIEIVAKDPRYPYSHKVAWIDKANYKIFYAEMYDKAGEFWKAQYEFQRPVKMKTPEGEELYYTTGANGASDFKTFTYSLSIIGDIGYNSRLDPRYFQPAALGTEF